MPSAIIVVGLVPTSATQAQIAPDGGTRTRVQQAASGRITVDIAPANGSGISHNTYSRFSVPSAGVGLNNRGVDASTIVNEVTSTQRSVLRGPIAVLGTRAHVVLANPNGITVDGGRFINTGGVALAAGPLRFESAGRGGRVNTVLSSGSGDISVGRGGLSGAMTTLQLVAGQLKIGGPVSNANVSSGAEIAVAGGRSEVMLDSSVSPLTTLRPLATRRDLKGSAKDIVVDVTPHGSLSASRVSLSVSGRGAGVSYAGRGQSTIGDFSITAAGRIRTRGARIQAERSLTVKAAAVEVFNRPERQSTLTSVTKTVTIVARTADLALQGQVTGAERSNSDVDSHGGVTLKAAGDVRLWTENADRLALAFASKDDLYVEAGGDLSNETGRLLANSALVLRVSGTVVNATATAPALASFHVAKRRHPGLLGSLFGVRRLAKIWTSDAGDSRVPGQLAYLAGESVDIRAAAVRNSGEVVALDGSLQIDTGTLVNAGSASGGYRIEKRCGLVCWTRGFSTASILGGRINAAGSADIRARAVVDNAGQIVANGNLSIAAPLVVGRAVYVPDIVGRPAGLYNAFSGPTALLSTVPTGGAFLAPAGTVSIDSPGPVLLAGGQIEGQVATHVPGGIDRREPAQAVRLGRQRPIGLFRPWLTQIP